MLHAEKAKSTHHKLALDALTHLSNAHAERWRNLFLVQVEPYLTGAKAPDKTFRDFVNHVLHVRDGLWGGAPKKVREWYGVLTDRLAARDWPAAAYAAGVLSHYYTDPLMPFHTGQSEREKVIHRAAEWSCTKSYDSFRAELNGALGWPGVTVPAGEDWLEQMTIDGAARANEFYDEFCERYDFAAGSRNPPAGAGRGLPTGVGALLRARGGGVRVDPGPGRSRRPARRRRGRRWGSSGSSRSCPRRSSG